MSHKLDLRIYKKPYNRNMMGIKRPHKKINRYGYHIYPTIGERIYAEARAIEAYLIRSGLKKQIK